MIKDCLKQLSFADEVIVLDQGSTDHTSQIARTHGAIIISSSSEDFSQNRNILKKQAKGEWLLYVDADERINSALQGEIIKSTTEGKYDAFYVSRKNFILGKWLRYGGWWPDYVPKLFRAKNLKEWIGPVHESPKVEGEYGYLKEPLSHTTARTVTDMFQKTIKWAKVEAELYFDAKHPKVSSLKIVKRMLSEFVNRYFFKRGLLDGVIGLIEAIFQSLHQAIILVYLWELQNSTESNLKKEKSK